MQINSIKDLNHAVERLDQLGALYRSSGVTPTEEVKLLETEIEAYKYHQYIKAQCSTCGAWEKIDGSYLVHTGVNFSPDQMYGRVCHLAKSRDRMCSNATPSDPERAKAQYGFQEVSPELLDAAIRFEINL